jgi:hypothetical protein
MLNLLPSWLGVLWAVVFLAVAVSHTRHLMHATGQRRTWHACHVLMAVSMAVMYAPSGIGPLSVPSAYWEIVFAGVGLAAAVWAIASVGRASTWIWLLTSIDLGAMLFMWTSTRDQGTAATTWLLAAYLLCEAAMWTLDLYRRIDTAAPLIGSWPLTTESGESVSIALSGTGGSGTLLGEHDISVSMIAMTLGMAYMLVAMQLMA